MRVSGQLVVAALLAATVAGCDVATEMPDPQPRVDEEAQAVRRDADTVTSHCRGGQASAREATAAVGRLIRRMRKHAAGDVWEQHGWRKLLTAVADLFERERCLPELVPTIDRALRRLPLAEPPPEWEPEPEPEYDYEPPYR